MKSTRTMRFAYLLTTCLLIAFASALVWAPGAHATLNVCDGLPTNPIDVEATVGTASASYATLTAAAAAINAGTHQGVINVEICGSTTEAGPVNINSSSSAPPASYTSINIHPLVDGVTISAATATGFGVIQLHAADSVTIDGDNPLTAGINRNLTITNTATTATVANCAVRIAVSTTAGLISADNNTIKNCNLNANVTAGNASGITSSTSSSAVSWGVYAGGGASATSATGTPVALTTSPVSAPSGTTINGLVVDNNAVNQAGRGVQFNGAATSVSTGVTVTNNVIGASGTATPATPPFTSPATTVYLKGIIVQGTAAVTVTGNTIQNLISYVASTINGIELTTAIGATVNISQNILNTVTQNTSASALRGILVSSASTSYTISGNTLTNLNQVGGSSIAGIEVSTAATSGTIDKNTLTTVRNRNTGGFGAWGISLAAGNAVTVQNNFVSDVLNVGTASFSTSFNADGIRVNSGINHKIYHNTVSLFGTSASTGTNSINCIAIAASSQTGIDVRNNIFSNTVSGGNASEAQSCVFLPFAASATMLLNLNNNAYYAAPVAGKNGIAFAGVSSYAAANVYSVAAFNPGSTSPATNFRAFSSSLGVSASDNASLASAAAAPFTSASNLHINTGLTPTQLESGGASVGVTTDIDGQTRPGPTGSVNGGATAPDIGADEFDGVPLDVTAPTISYTALSNTTNTAGPRTLSVTVTDVSGVPTSGTGLPVLYYRKNAGAYTSSQCAFVSGSAYTCTITYAPLGGVVTGDVVGYYVAAQDNAGNVTTNPSAGASGFTANPPAAATPPTTPSSYVIGIAYSGSYSVGSAETITSLTNAGGIFQLLDNGVVTGNITINITSDLTGESGSFGLVQLSEEGVGGYTVTVQPSGAARTVTGTGTGAGLIILSGADRIVFNGSVGGAGTDRSLTLINPNTAAGTGTVFVLSQGTGAGATNDTFKNCIIKAGSIGTTSNFTFGMFVGDVSGAAAGADNDNLTLQNNQITRGRTAVQIVGTAAGPIDGLVVTGNTLGDDVIASSLGRLGLVLSTANSPSVTNNTIKNIFLTSDTSSPAGMSLASLTGGTISGNTVTTIQSNGSLVPAGIVVSGSTGMTITQNTVDGVTGGLAGVGSGDTFGIALSTGFINSKVTRNTVRNIGYNGVNGYAGRGIDINPGTASAGLEISNNTVANITGDSWNSILSDSIVGIRVGVSGGLAATAGGIKLYFNSVNLGTGAFTGNSSGTLSAAIYFSSLTSGIDLRDNVFATNLVNNTAGTAKTYAIYSDAAPAAFTFIDGNDYYATGSQGVLGFISSLDRTTIGAWSGVTGQDGSSKAVDPQFNSATNLQPTPASPVLDAGVSLAGLVVPYVDITGATRVDPPSMGAYESGLDVAGPAISYTALGNDIPAANRHLTVSVTDFSGVPTSGVGLPVIKFRKSPSLIYASTQCSFISGSNYDCVIDYSLVTGGSVSPGDTIQYFVIAQDNANNVSANPSAGAGGFTANPPNAGTPPTTPNSYLISTPFSGTFQICAACTYTSLTGATGIFNALNNGVVTGNVNIEISEDLLTGETGAVALNAVAAPWVVKIYPTNVSLSPDTTPRKITSTTAPAGGFIRLNSADRVVIDGSNNGNGSTRDLTITESNTGTSTAVIWLQSNGTDGCTNNTIRNVNIVGNVSAGVPNTLIGIGAGSTSVSSSSLGTNHNNNTYQNNSITGVQFGIYSSGASTTTKNSTTTITQNVTTTPIRRAGVLLGFEDNDSITDNTIDGVSSASTGEDTFGISLGSSAITATGNTGNEVTNTTIARNKIGSVLQTATYSAVGIFVGPVTTGTNKIINNSIWGVNANATPGDVTAGIFINGGGTAQVYYNSVSLTGDRGTGTTSPGYAMAVGGTNPTVDLRNNSFYNTQTTTSTGHSYAIGLNYASPYTGLTSNYNDLYTAGTSAFFAITGSLTQTSGTDRTSLALWTAETGKDTPNTISTDPLYTSATNLAPTLTSPLIGAASSAVAVATDINGAARSATAPTIGAYEATAELSVSKTDSPDPVLVGTNLTYTITVSNTGPYNAQNATLNESTPANTRFVSISAPAGWVCGTTPAVGGTGPIVCTAASQATGSAVFTLVVSVNYCNSLALSNTATVSSPTADPNPLNNSATAGTAVTNPGCGVIVCQDLTCSPTLGCQYAPSAPGTFCGNPAATFCDAQDTCNGAGTCVDRKQDPGTICLAGNGTVCNPDDVCDGLTNACAVNIAPEDTNCGNPSQGPCDLQDTCNATGTCIDHKRDPGYICLPGTGVCDPNDTCDGSSNACAQVYAPVTQTCGDAESQCVNQDYCNGSGACQDNGFKASGTPCDDLSGCTSPDACDGNGTCTGTVVCRDVKVPAASEVCAGGDVVVPIIVDAATGVTSMDFDLSYNSAVLTAIGVSKTPFTDGFSMTSNLTIPGHVVISMSGGGPLVGTGEVAWVLFHAIGPVSSVSNLAFPVHNLNGGVILSSAIGGTVTVDGTPVVISTPNNVSSPPLTNKAVPVHVNGGAGLYSFDITIRFNPAVVDSISAAKAPATSSTDWVLTTNFGTSGLAVISLFSSSPLVGASVDIATITYHVTGALGSSTALDITVGTSDDFVATCLSDGFFRVCADDDGDGYTTCDGDCNDGDASVHPGVPDTTCDGVDNNCNGSTDEGYVPPPTSCGSGVCASTGLLVCLSGGVTSDTCNPNSTNGNACSDGSVCTTIDACLGGVCTGTAPLNCDDSNVCTTDSCHPVSGCNNAPICTIAGHIYYNKVTAAGPNPPNPGTDGADVSKPMKGQTVLRTSNLSPNAFATTDNNGLYQLTNDAGGNVTLTPQSLAGEEAECQSSITAADATMTANAAVGNTVLSPNQKTAADATNNGTVSSLDASFIAQKAVATTCTAFFLPVESFYSSAWAFSPTSRSYSPLTGLQNYDFIGILYGDVTGNWSELPPIASESAAPGLGGVPVDTGAPSDLGTVVTDQAARKTVLYMATAPQRRQDGLYDVVLGLQNADGILGLDMALHYDSNAIAIRGIASTGIASTFNVESRNIGGIDSLALYGVGPMQGTGQFLVVTIEILGPLSGGAPFEVSALANEGQIPVSIGTPGGGTIHEVTPDLQ